MYNLNYTYLTELEVDTRQTFTDISDDLILVFNDDTYLDNVFRLKTLISCWQDYFWKTDNPNKRDLNVMFTDISIIHNDDVDYQGRALDDNEMMTVEELSAFLDSLDTPHDGYSGYWAGNRNFTELCSTLTAAIDALHSHLDYDKLYPIGSIVIDSEKPSVGKWTKVTPSYLSENITKEMSGTELGSGVGYHAGKTMGTITYTTDLNSAKITPALIRSDIAPSHTHQLKFNPESGSGSGGNSEGTEVLTGACTYTNIRRGEERSGKYKNPDGDTYKNTACHLAVSKSASVEKGDHDSMQPTFTVTSAETKPDISTIYLAPTTYPLTAFIWQRNQEDEEEENG